MSTNLFRRGATYYVRVATPKALQDLRRSIRGTCGSREVLRSLGTKELARARSLQPAALAAIYRTFEHEATALRSAGAAELTVPSDQEIHSAAFEFRAAEIRLDERERMHRPGTAEFEARVEAVRGVLAANPHWTPLQQMANSGYLELESPAGISAREAEKRGCLEQALRQALVSKEFHLVDWAVEDVAHRHRWRIERGSPAYRQLAWCLTKAWLKALETSAARDSGAYDDIEQTVVPLSPKRTSDGATRAPARGERLQDHFENYLKERHPSLSHSGLKDRRATVRQFVECSGNKAATDYRKADMAAYKKLLSELPARVEKLYPGLPLAKAVEMNRKAGHPGLKTASIRNKLSTLSAFGDWLADNVDGVDAGNFKVSLPRKVNPGRMEPFSDSQIAAILNARAFTGCESDKNQLEPGEHRIRDWRYWLPLILAFTGARLNEVVQLRVEDVRQVDDVWAFEFTDRGAGQSLKTSSSRRVVPLHPILLELGILGFRDEAHEAGRDDIFYRVPCDRDGRHSTYAGKWFRKFLVRIGVKGNDLGGAHRWRHTLADSLRRGGVNDFDIGRLLGHEVNVARMTSHYGREVDLPLRAKLELITRASYPSVDFQLLK